MSMPGLELLYRKTREVARHGLSIMRHENSAGLRGNPEHIRIANAHGTAIVSPHKIDRRFSPAKRPEDLVAKLTRFGRLRIAV